MTTPLCPSCNKRMVLRNSARGSFYGCSFFPKCRGTRDVIKYPAHVEEKPGTIFNNAIWDFLINGEGHGMVEAVAGSGKTYTIVNGVIRVRTGIKIGVLSYNNHIIRELSAQLQKAGITWVKALTYNSLGNRAVKGAFPALRDSEIFEGKIASIVSEVVAAYPIKWENDDEIGAFHSGVTRLVKMCQNYLEDGDDIDALREIAEKHSIEFNGEECEDITERENYAFSAVKPVLDRALSCRTIMDWADQVWWTVKLKLAVEAFDMLLIDEAQDTNKMRQELAMMACPRGRILFVGDNRQSIYGFTGTDDRAMPNLRERLVGTGKGCTDFPLPVCRRCPRSHVRLAQAIVPHIEACQLERDGIEAPEGEIHSITLERAADIIQPGDLGQSRRNADLIPFAYALIKMGKKVVVRGRDIGKGLEALIKKLRPKNILDLMEKLSVYRQKEMEKLTAAGNETDSPKVTSLTDKCDCLQFLCDGIDTVTALLKNIASIFSDFDNEGKPKEAVILGTIHRTKGLEAYNVFILAPEYLPMKTRKDWERVQERNLCYIAVTRAKYLIRDGQVIEPGRLFFLGGVPSVFKANWMTGASHPASAALPPAESDWQPTDDLPPAWKKPVTRSEWEAEKEIRDIEGSQW